MEISYWKTFELLLVLLISEIIIPESANRNKSRLLFSSAESLRSLYGKQCGPRSDCSCRSSLFWVHTVRFYT